MSSSLFSSFRTLIGYPDQEEIKRRLHVDIEVERIKLTMLFDSTNGPQWKDKTRH